MEQGPPPMDHTSVSCGSLEEVEGVGQVTLEVDHVETVTWLMELLCRWLKQNAGHVIYVCLYDQLNSTSPHTKITMSSQLCIAITNKNYPSCT